MFMEPVAIDWGYAIATLIIRFVGIFVVLGLLQVVMQITGRIFAHLDAKEKALAASDVFSQQDAAAVGMALFLKDRNR
jgi:hypothetical protein